MLQEFCGTWLGARSRCRRGEGTGPGLRGDTDGRGPCHPVEWASGAGGGCSEETRPARSDRRPGSRMPCFCSVPHLAGPGPLPTRPALQALSLDFPLGPLAGTPDQNLGISSKPQVATRLHCCTSAEGAYLRTRGGKWAENDGD